VKEVLLELGFTAGASLQNKAGSLIKTKQFQGGN
jgi:hypothetical protein